jgi:hypothetical protein
VSFASDTRLSRYEAHALAAGLSGLVHAALASPARTMGKAKVALVEEDFWAGS